MPYKEVEQKWQVKADETIDMANRASQWPVVRNDLKLQVGGTMKLSLAGALIDDASTSTVDLSLVSSAT